MAITFVLYVEGHRFNPRPVSFSVLCSCIYLSLTSFSNQISHICSIARSKNGLTTVSVTFDLPSFLYYISFRLIHWQFAKPKSKSVPAFPIPMQFALLCTDAEDFTICSGRNVMHNQFLPCLYLDVASAIVA